ncbi:MAG: hypothetical protein QM780_05330 [Hyphomicrobium sp.]|uniref:hypothetical protein n=1 Tax=Hyphomicrobium sp. TaxID=82 RepID=UPI0039E3FE03
MTLQVAHTTLMLPEAIVIESLLTAYGIRHATFGKDLVCQAPQLAIFYGGVSFLVSEEDLTDAQRLIAEGEVVPGYVSIESESFEVHPLRNAILGFLITIMGAPFPFWYRNAGRKSATDRPTSHLAN